MRKDPSPVFPELLREKFGEEDEEYRREVRAPGTTVSVVNT
jgi:hypothetical protein